MSKLIEELKNSFAEAQQHEEYECNYADNYYGDQVCQPKSTD